MHHRNWWTIPVTALMAVSPSPAVALAQQPVGRLVEKPRSQSDSNAIPQQISLSVRDSTLAYVLQTVARQGGVRLSYNRDLPVLANRVTVQIVKANVMDALTQALRGSGLVATRTSDGHTVVIRPQDARKPQDTVPAATTKIHGTIVDSATGTGIARATILIQGTKDETITDDAGAFILSKIPPGEIRLSVRRFGYKSVERIIVVPESGQLTVRVSMVPTATTLSGIVTTATGTQRRMEVGQDITVLNVDSVMRTAPVSSVTELLETRVPGLIALHSSGAPGAPAKIRLRGQGSITRNSEPILIVDGVRVNDAKNKSLDDTGPSPLNQIDVNSIETIEVFKGPSASAMYGADAGDGVIVITTKRGQAGRIRWNIAADEGMSKMVNKWPINFFRFGHDPKSLALSGGSRVCGPFEGCILDSIVEYQALNNPRLSPFGTGNSSGLSLNVSGGTGATTYSFTGSLKDEVGLRRLPAFAEDLFRTNHGVAAPNWMKRPDQYTQWGLTSRFDLRLGASGATAGITSALFNSVRKGGSKSTSGYITGLQGEYLDTLNSTVTRLYLGNDYNGRFEVNERRTQNNVVINWPLRSWLPLQFTGGIDTRIGESSQLIPRGYSTYADSIGTYTLSREQGMVQTLRASTTLRVPGGGRLPNVMLPMGFNWTGSSRAFLQGGADGIPEGVEVPSALGDPTVSQQNRIASATYGWFLAPTLDLRSRVFVSPGFRFDGGNAIGSRAGFSLLPKLDFSWIALDRGSSTPLFGVLSLLRPRMAVGVAGVQPNPGDQLRTFLPASRVTIGSGTAASTEGVFLRGIGNSLLRPEKVRELEGGLDADLWGSRVSLTLSAYQKLRHDAIISVPIAPSLGGFGYNQTTGTGQLMNIGDVRNRGFESTINAIVLDGSTVGWRINSSLSKNDNKLLRLAPGMNEIRTDGAGRLVPGYPLFGKWNRPIIGYADADGDGRIGKDEVRIADSASYVGAQLPDFELNAGTTVSFWNGRLSVSTAINYQSGLTQLDQSAVEGAFVRRFDNPGLSLSEQAEVAALATYGTGSYGISTVTDVIRWQSLSINVEVPARIARLLRGSSMAVAVQGSNLGVHANYRGKDPSVGVSGDGNTVRDTGTFPMPRLWQLRFVVRN